ncbi:MAG TPA: hypothetical protein VFE58_02980, partial [Tepidisphaeraceae bacterium]|nr:hypothetical protein [Tepidisphaeraceae bacterium]
MQKRKHLSPRSAVCACTFLATSLCCLLSLAQPIGTLTGSITADYSSSTDPNTNITTYSFINASENLNLNVPTIPVSATSSGYWSDPFIWNGAPILLLNDGVTIAGVFSDVVGAFLSIPSTANTLINSGPTEQSPSIPGLNLSSNFLGINASFSVGANLTYDVTIPTGINVTMDQPTVAIHSLYLESGGMLSGNGNFIVRTSLLNQGTLQNLDGTIQGDFENNSYADITGSLAVQGTFTNLGSLYIESMGSLNLSTDSSNSGKIDLLGGSLNAPDTFINNGVFNWYGGTLPNTFRNSGQMAISNSGNQTINGAATVTNSGTILQSTGASLTMGGTTNTYNGDRYPSVLNNLS